MFGGGHIVMLMVGGPKPRNEARRMVAEKVLAAGSPVADWPTTQDRLCRTPAPISGSPNSCPHFWVVRLIVG